MSQTNIIGVQFEEVGKIYYFDASRYPELKPGDPVIVRTSRGLQLAHISQVQIAEENLDLSSFKSVERPATPQDLLQRNASNPVGKGLSSLTPQVSVFLSAHGWCLFTVDVPASEAGTGQTPCASPAFFNGLRPRRMVGRRYLIKNGGGVNHPQNL
mgnify:CR=1 FL=1